MWRRRGTKFQVKIKFPSHLASTAFGRSTYLGLAAAIFSYRRWQDVQIEIREREKTLEYIRELLGRNFYLEVVDVFLRMVDEGN